VWWSQVSPSLRHRRVAAIVWVPTTATMLLGQCLAVAPRTRLRVRLLLVSGAGPHRRRRHLLAPRHRHRRPQVPHLDHCTREESLAGILRTGHSTTKLLTRMAPQTSRELLVKQITFIMGSCTFAHLPGHLPCLTGQRPRMGIAVIQQSSS